MDKSYNKGGKLSRVILVFLREKATTNSFKKAGL